MKRFDLIRTVKGYLDSVADGLDPSTGEGLPSFSAGLLPEVHDAMKATSVQLGGLLGGDLSRNAKPGSVDSLYDSISVLESLAAGRQPGSGEVVEKDDPVGDVRMRRAFSVAHEAMDGIFDKARGRSKASFRLPPDVMAEIVPDEEPVLVTGLVKNVNSHNPDPERVCGIQAQLVNDWLQADGVLAQREQAGQIRRPTEKGEGIGLSVEPRVNKDGQSYDGVIFSKDAQQYVLDHLDDISAFAREQRLERDKAREAERRNARKENAVAKAAKKANAVRKGPAQPSAMDLDMDVDGLGL